MTEEEYKKHIEDISNSNFLESIMKYIMPMILLLWVLVIVAAFIWLIVNF